MNTPYTVTLMVPADEQSVTLFIYNREQSISLYDLSDTSEDVTSWSVIFITV